MGDLNLLLSTLVRTCCSLSCRAVTLEKTVLRQVVFACNLLRIRTIKSEIFDNELLQSDLVIAVDYQVWDPVTGGNVSF